MTYTVSSGTLNSTIPYHTMCLDIERVQQMAVLGVVINDRLSASDHVTYLITSLRRFVSIS